MVTNIFIHNFLFKKISFHTWNLLKELVNYLNFERRPFTLKSYDKNFQEQKQSPGGVL